MRSKFSRWGMTVLTMVSVATVVLLVTGWGSAMASSVSSVLVANTASNPAQVHEAGTANVHVTNTTAMPVNAQNLNTDTSGNLKVAQQGTADVNVTNSSLSVTPQAPITGGGSAVSGSTQLTTTSQIQLALPDATEVASALQIHMSPEIGNITLLDGGNVVAAFYGPAANAPSDIDLALTRPIQFDTAVCLSHGAGSCSLGWIGNN